MKVINYLDTKAVREIPGITMREVISADDGASNFSMRFFEVEPGSATKPHSHWWEHGIFVLSGQGLVVGEEGETKMAEGSVIYIAPEEPHHFVNNGTVPLRYILLNSLKQ